MNYTENNPKAGEYLRLTLAFLAKYKLSANPINYTVWYEYVSGKNLKLKQALDTAIAGEQPLSNKNIEAVYQKFVADGDRIVIARLLTKVNLMLKEITGHVLETEGDLAGHGQALGNLTGQLSGINDYEGIQTIIDQMLDQTRALVQSGSTLQRRMKVSSEDLGQLQMELEKSQKEARTDSLTGLANRRGLEKRLEIERIRARQNNTPFSVILIDIDYFKKVNDTYGHLVGDSLLRGISRILREQIRRNDLAARYGGEEFLIVLPDTGISGARAAAEKIKTELSAREWKLKESGEPMGLITVSMGIALYAVDESDNEVIHRADTALYQAKSQGRNRIVTQMIVPQVNPSLD